MSVYQSGAEDLRSGVASGTIVFSGGREYIGAGGIDTASMVDSGGMAFIYSGGSISGMTIERGANVVVSAGGLVQGGLTLSGGRTLIYGTVSDGQMVSFEGSGGYLGVDHAAAFGAVIGGFAAGDIIHLGTFDYSSAATRSFTEAANHASGTLTVRDGGLTANLTLAGVYATSNFVLTSNSDGTIDVKY